MERTWTCRRTTKGVACRQRNPSRLRKCIKCGKTKPVKKYPAHRQVLKDLTYDDYIQRNGGEYCWIHKRLGLADPPRTKRLQRDHNHNTGAARGLLCYRCNRQLPPWITAAWLRAAADYLDKFGG